MNVPAARLGLGFDDDPEDGRSDDPPVRFAPPGALVVLAWLVLLPGLGAAHWLLTSAGAPGATRAGVLVLAVLASTYAWTTVGVARLTGIRVEVLGLAVNAVVVALATTVSIASATVEPLSALLVAAVAAWTLVASVSVVQYVVTGAVRG